MNTVLLDIAPYKLRKCCDKLLHELNWYNEEGAIWVEDGELYYAYTKELEGELEDYYGTINECPNCGKHILLYQLINGD